MFSSQKLLTAVAVFVLIVTAKDTNIDSILRDAGDKIDEGMFHDAWKILEHAVDENDKFPLDEKVQIQSKLPNSQTKL